MSSGGPLKSIQVKGRTFSCAGDADVGRQLGGVNNEMLPNGDQTAREIKTAVIWKLSGVTVEIDDDNEDQQYLEDVKNASGPHDFVAEYPDGSEWQGDGQIIGELSYSNNGKSITFDCGGGGALKPL